MMSSTQVYNERRKWIRKIQSMLEPFLRGSGYVDHKHPSGKLQICCPVFQTKEDQVTNIRVLGEVIEIRAFLHDSIMTDAYGGGAVTEPYTTCSLETLMAITRKLNTLITRHQIG